MGSTVRSDLDAAREVADAVLYEGYVLYPYRASAVKNRYRWQWGVLAPRRHVEAADVTERDRIVSKTLVRVHDRAEIKVTARFLHERHRQVLDASGRAVSELDVDDELHTTWDEGVEHEVSTGPIAVAALIDRPWVVRIDLDESREVEEVADRSGQVAAQVVRTTEPVSGRLRVSADRLGPEVVRVTATVDNETDWTHPDAPRDAMLRRSLIGVHLLLVARDATFASAIDPPAWAQPWAADCDNRGTHPVLVGDDDRIVLSAPIILYDHPEIAPESAGPSFDATEIDELLTLAVAGLTDEEKRAARATDPRAAEIVDRSDGLPPQIMERLHGAIREFDAVTGDDSPAQDPSGWPQRRGTVADPRGDPHLAPVPFGDGGPEIDDATVDVLGLDEQPIERVVVDGQAVEVGSRVRLEPSRRADAQDMFAEGRVARVERIVRDLDGETHVAVVLEDDPAADLHGWYGRFLYFRADEVRPLPEEEER